MKTEPNDSIHSQLLETRTGLGEWGNLNVHDTSNGLTKREYFASVAMQGLLSDDSFNLDTVIEQSVKMADKLIEELNKTT